MKNGVWLKFIDFISLDSNFLILLGVKVSYRICIKFV